MTPEEILNSCLSIMEKKAHDYTQDPSINRFENFDKSSIIISWFTNDRDRSFAGIIGIKIARLSALLSTGKIPNNESISDNFRDLINYCALWAGDIEARGEKLSTPKRMMWMCSKKCGFAVYSPETYEFIGRYGYHRNLSNAMVPNLGIAFCPNCKDETLVPF